MCNFALVGARTDAAALRRILSGKDWDLDTDVGPDPGALGCFPPADTVICVTTQGCSCALLQGLGLSHGARREMHVAGPGYVFRCALAAATLRFGGIRLLAHNPATAALDSRAPRRRTTTLGQFLRSGLEPDDGVLSIIG